MKNYDKKKVFEYVELDKNTRIQKLSILDQIRILIKRITYNPEHELDIDETLSETYMQLKADLFDLFYKASEPIRKGIHRTVRLKVSSEFKPVISEVINSPRLKKHYKIAVSYPDIDYNVKFFYQVDMEVRK